MTMKRTLAVLALVGALAVVGAAVAALPQKSATYVGDIKASPFTMLIDMRVDPAGTKLEHFTYLCGTGRPPTSVFGIVVDSTGRFTHTKMAGSIVVWKLAGHFVTPTSA